MVLEFSPAPLVMDAPIVVSIQRLGVNVSVLELELAPLHGLSVAVL